MGIHIVLSMVAGVGTIPTPAWSALERLIIPASAVIEFEYRGDRVLFVSAGPEQQFAIREMEPDPNGERDCMRFLRSGAELYYGQPDLQAEVSVRQISARPASARPGDLWVDRERLTFLERFIPLPRDVVGGVDRIELLRDAAILTESEFDGERYVCTIHANIWRNPQQAEPNKLRFVYDPKRDVVESSEVLEGANVIVRSQVEYNAERRPTRIQSGHESWQILDWRFNTPDARVPGGFAIGRVDGTRITFQGDESQLARNRTEGPCVWFNGAVHTRQSAIDLKSQGFQVLGADYHAVQLLSDACEAPNFRKYPVCYSLWLADATQGGAPLSAWPVLAEQARLTMNRDRKTRDDGKAPDRVRGSIDGFVEQVRGRKRAAEKVRIQAGVR